jgi:hypothetical protein
MLPLLSSASEKAGRLLKARDRHFLNLYAPHQDNWNTISASMQCGSFLASLLLLPQRRGNIIFPAIYRNIAIITPQAYKNKTCKCIYHDHPAKASLMRKEWSSSG